MSSAYKTLHAPPSSREHTTSDKIGLDFSQVSRMNQDPGPMLDSELGLTEMSEAEYSHLQHFFQAQMEAQVWSPDGPHVRPSHATAIVKDSTSLTASSLNLSAQAIDLSASSDDHTLVMQGEKTPVTYGEVPDSVLSRVKGEESPIEPSATRRTSLQNQAKPSVRVCLEKRFNSLGADTAKTVLTAFQGSAEAQGAVTHLQKHTWMKSDKPNSFSVSTSNNGGVFDPVTNMYGQVVSHMVEPTIHQGFFCPKSVSFNFHPDRLVTKTVFTDNSSLKERQELVNPKDNVVAPGVYRNLFPPHDNDATAASDMVRKSQKGRWKRGQAGISVSQRKERHNSKERERRKKIRLCCDELNKVVPFCDSDTDKVTTLKWTLSYIRYINIIYGNAIKEEFKKLFTQERGMLKSSSFSGDPFHHETNEMESSPLAAEQ